ncbi:MAG TPA: DUF4386 family protein [Anaerolineae bacterium]
MMKKVTDATADSNWRGLYRVAGAAALISAVFIPIQIIVFMISQPPFQGTVGDWFMLLQNNKLFGLVDMDLLLVADNVLLIPIFLALYIVLRRGNESTMLIATALGFVGIVFFITTNPAFEMLSLSEKYAAAATDVQRAIFLAAGQAMLATWQGTAFQVAYITGSIAGIVIGVVMMQSGVFSKVTGWMGILANAVGFGLYVPAIGVYISVFSVFFLEAWYVLIARSLFQLGSGVAKERRISQVSSAQV